MPKDGAEQVNQKLFLSQRTDPNGTPLRNPKVLFNTNTKFKNNTKLKKKVYTKLKDNTKLKKNNIKLRK